MTDYAGDLRRLCDKCVHIGANEICRKHSDNHCTEYCVEGPCMDERFKQEYLETEEQNNE